MMWNWIQGPPSPCCLSRVGSKHETREGVKSGACFRTLGHWSGADHIARVEPAHSCSVLCLNAPDCVSLKLDAFLRAYAAMSSMTGNGVGPRAVLCMHGALVQCCAWDVHVAGYVGVHIQGVPELR